MFCLSHVNVMHNTLLNPTLSGLSKDEKKNCLVMSSRLIERDVVDGLRNYTAQLIKINNRYKLNRLDTLDDSIADTTQWKLGDTVYINNRLKAFRVFQELCSDPACLKKYESEK